MALGVIAGVTVITFTLSQVVPSDPARLYAGARARPEQVAAIRQQLGLDESIVRQFQKYAGRLLRGDLGESFRTRRPIVEDLKVFLPATLELVLLSTIVALVGGISIGVLAAADHGKAFDTLGRLVTISGVSIPAFWLAILFQLLFFSSLGWLPAGGRIGRDVLLEAPIHVRTGFHLVDAALQGNWFAWRDALRHLVLPTAVLATYPVALVARMTRAAMLEVLTEPYITAAEAAGLPRRTILFRLALKNALIPTLTVLGLSFAYSLTGAVLIELVFSWPGLGKYVTDAIVRTDFPVIVGVTLVVTVIYVSINLVIDLVQLVLDPRIELK